MLRIELECGVVSHTAASVSALVDKGSGPDEEGDDVAGYDGDGGDWTAVRGVRWSYKTEIQCNLTCCAPLPSGAKCQRHAERRR